MAARDDSVAADMHFSSSSSFSSVSAPTDDEKPYEVPSSAASMPLEGGSRGHRRPNEPRNAGPLSRLYAEAAREAAQLARAPIVLPNMQSASVTSSRDSGERAPPSTNTRGGADGGRRSFSALRDSADPPETSRFFDTGLTGASARADVAVALTWEVESLEEITTPRSSIATGLAAAPAPLPTSHTVSLSSPSSSCATQALPTPSQRAEVSAGSMPSEFVIVNAAQAQAAHVQLASFSAATMAQYRLVKLKVAQRIYRVYYDKWQRALRSHTGTPMPALRVHKNTQTPAPVRTRSVSIGTDFTDVDSYHASRSQSRAGDTPRSRAADATAAAGAAYVPPAPSPSPRRAESEWRPSAAAVAASPAVGHSFSPSPAPAGVEGIAVRTKPSLLVDYGRHSDAPPRKSRPPVSSPAVELPAVVPEPERIFRL